MQPGDIPRGRPAHLPVTTKNGIQLHPGVLCVPRNRIIDYVTTSGTSATR